MSDPSTSPTLPELSQRHRLFGWWSLFVFLGMGLVLEGLHGFKLGWLLDADHEARRLLLRLAHTHGTLFGLIHLAFSAELRRGAGSPQGWQSVASACLIGASVCMPGGFILGALFLHAGEPGLGVLLAPLGGLLVLIGVFLVARGLGPAR